MFSLFPLQKANDKAAVDRIFKDLDRNKDNSVDFNEFVTLVCCLTQMCHEYFIGKKQRFRRRPVASIEITATLSFYRKTNEGIRSDYCLKLCMKCRANQIKFFFCFNFFCVKHNGVYFVCGCGTIIIIIWNVKFIKKQ